MSLEKGCHRAHLDIDNTKVAFVNRNTEWSSEPIAEPVERKAHGCTDEDHQ